MAKPKKKPARTRNSSKAIPAAAADTEVSSSSDFDEAAQTVEPLKPVTRRPILFKISLVAFVGWLIYLAYIAYVVLG